MVKTKNDCVGKIFPTNSSGNIIILEYVNYLTVRVKFINSGSECLTTMTQVLKGTVKDRSIPTVYGHGILGNVYSSKIDGRPTHEYTIWHHMLRRCYNETYHSVNPSYSDCIASQNFLHYTYFYEWCQRQIGFNNEGWELDKDLLIKGNKVYSEDTCVFLPKEINQALITRYMYTSEYPTGVFITKTGRFQAQYSVGGVKTHVGIYDEPLEAFLAYKQAKEQYLQYLAYKYEELLDPRAFNALLYYQV